MKRIINIFCIIVLVLSSCKKVLETQPYNKISEDVVWSNKANAETFIFSTYGIMGNYYFGTSSDGRTLNMLPTDGTHNTFSPIFTETIDRNSGVGGFNNFSAIRRCNLIIERVGTSTGISDPDKKLLIAEGKFLRAMSYYQVARNVGRICWIDKVLTPEDELKLPSTKTPSESYAYIIKDLEEAVADMSKDKIPGRANKYVAAAFLSEVCLQAAAYKNYPNPPALAANDPLIDKAITYANMVINEGGYALVSNYGGMFNETNPTASEIIYASYSKALNTQCVNTPMQSMIPNINDDKLRSYGAPGDGPAFNEPIRAFDAWIEHTPPYNLAKDYLTIDKADNTKALPWDQTSQYLAAVDEGTSSIPKQANETYVKKGKIKTGSTETVWTLTNVGRDARWAQTMVSDSNIFLGRLIRTSLNGNATRWLQMKVWGYSASNYYWRKGIYTNVQPHIYWDSPTDYHFVCMRLGRVYLNLAEAYLLKGDLANALLNLNKTRVVHGQLPPSIASNLTTAWKDYKRERHVDLVMENDYYWSLLRWGRYGGDANSGLASGGTIPELTEVPQVMDNTKDSKEFTIVEGPFAGQNNLRAFNPQRRYLLPIQQSLIDNNVNFGPQNVGW